MDHYNQKQLRKAEYIKPPNLIKTKVGSGGLPDAILEKAQKIINEDKTDFRPISEGYLGAIKSALELARSKPEDVKDEALIASILYPAVQLKANGGMFNFPVITIVADRLVQFLEVIKRPDDQAQEIVLGFYTAMRAIIMGNMKGPMTKHSEELLEALNDACVRYFTKNPDELYSEESKD